ncbi:flagellar FliJ family protein [Rhodopirellula sp. JC639]|uniref:flagellar FliJ family protein n=1 Tax=Stieleria mannarensis TaxID=2755585 RepID=UPI001603AEA7|nr:flagellar FliJ family protein [Rhodopirellula sp. JC639]
MSELKKKIDRIRRIHSIESSQLNVLIGELARIDALLMSHRQRLEEFESVKRRGLEITQNCSIEFLTQTHLWIDSIDRSIKIVRDVIAKCEAERHEARSRVMDQRTRVRGLEILMDQRRLEFDADAMTQQMLLADENALKKYARN